MQWKLTQGMEDAQTHRRLALLITVRKQSYSCYNYKKKFEIYTHLHNVYVNSIH